MNFTAAEIQPFFSPNALSAGALYQNQGRVQAFEQNGDIISARVLGNESKPYRQSILVEREDGRLRVSRLWSKRLAFRSGRGTSEPFSGRTTPR